MDGHYDILRRAVEHMPEPDRRQAVYNHARRVLVQHMQAAQPPIPEVVIEAERSTLEAAIRRVEAEMDGRALHGQVGPLDIAEAPAPPTSGFAVPQWMIAPAAVAVGRVALGITAAVLPRGSQPPAPNPPPSRAVVQKSEQDARVEIDDRSPPTDASAAAGRSYTYGRQLTYFRTTHPAGTMIIDKGQRFLYLIRANTSAVRYGIGLGRECFDLPALMQVTRKVTAQPGAKDEAALGPRRVILDTDTRLIHGTNRPDTIGHSVWLGCVRLMNEDIIDLYDQAAVGGRVVVIE